MRTTDLAFGEQIHGVEPWPGTTSDVDRVMTSTVGYVGFFWYSYITRAVARFAERNCSWILPGATHAATW